MALLGLGAISVPLQHGAPVAQLRPVTAETEPVVIASSVEHLDDAVELALTGHLPRRLVVFDFRSGLDDHRDALAAATTRLAATAVAVETLADVVSRGSAPPMTPWVEVDDDAPALLIHTAGSTGISIGAMYTVMEVTAPWRQANTSAVSSAAAFPAITLNYLPMSHVVGRSVLHQTLGAGGTAYFVAASDLSTFFDDLSLLRPTRLNFEPQIWDMLVQLFHGEVDRRSPDGADRRTVEADVLVKMREKLLGGRFTSAVTTSAPISSGTRSFIESLVDMHVTDGHGLGYFRTDAARPQG